MKHEANVQSAAVYKILALRDSLEVSENGAQKTMIWICHELNWEKIVFENLDNVAVDSKGATKFYFISRL